MKLTKEQQDFVTKNHNLILSYLGKHNLSYEDYYDILAIALCKAALKYDAKKGIAFSTYAFKCFYNAVSAYVRNLKNRKRHTDNLIHITDENEDSVFFNSITLNVDSASDIIKLTDKYDLFSYLTPKEKEAYEYLRQGYTQAEIAKMLGKSRQNISRHCRSAIEKLTRLIHKEQSETDVYKLVHNLY